jgi:hypothetical protein
MSAGLATPARAVVVRAYACAARDHAGQIREEHLLEAVLDDAEGGRLLGSQVVVGEDGWWQLLAELGDSRRKGGITEAEQAALSSLGIDVDAVLRQVEERLGSHAVAAEEPQRSRWWRGPALSADALRVLAEAERHLPGTAAHTLGVGQLALALVTAPTALAEGLARRGVSEAGVRSRLAAPSGLGGPR